MPNEEETSVIEDFDERYRARDVEAARAVEMAALGISCGTNGYTTLEQADRLADLIPLRPWDRVLDIGCGCGWPGLHLARRYHCRVVGTDLPMEGLLRAGQNNRELAGRGSIASVRCSARRLPFAPSSFHAVVHADVLC